MENKVRNKKEYVGFWRTIIRKIFYSMYDHTGKVSSSRISSYGILVLILVSSVVFVGVDIINALSQWEQGLIYEIPYTHVVIFGLILTHHLFLLGIKKSSESSPYPGLNELKRKPNYESSEEVTYNETFDNESCSCGNNKKCMCN
jgi:hypothetical protein